MFAAEHKLSANFINIVGGFGLTKIIFRLQNPESSNWLDICMCKKYI